jgi:hypothetical protein
VEDFHTLGNMTEHETSVDQIEPVLRQTVRTKVQLSDLDIVRIEYVKKGCVEVCRHYLSLGADAATEPASYRTCSCPCLQAAPATSDTKVFQPAHGSRVVPFLQRGQAARDLSELASVEEIFAVKNV